jgi:hypothetical protein
LPREDPSKTKLVIWLPVIIALSGTIGGAISWAYGEYVAYRKEKADAVEMAADKNKQLVDSYLLPLKLKLDHTRSVFTQLGQYDVDGYGILESYVIRAKQKGDETLSLQYGLITDLVQTDAEIATLLEGYDPFHITSAFKLESDSFLEHARTYIIRFKALPSIIKTGAPLPGWKVFPQGFPSALEAEISARGSPAKP